MVYFLRAIKNLLGKRSGVNVFIEKLACSNVWLFKKRDWLPLVSNSIPQR